MRSDAYKDFAERLRESIALVRAALGTSDARFAAALSKSAAVLIAANLERYVDAAVDQACRRIKVGSWDDLSPGYQRFLGHQIALRLARVVEPINEPRDASPKRLDSLLGGIRESAEAIEKPETWSHLPAFGMFMDGAAAPARINAVLRDFDPQGRDLMTFVEQRGADRGAVARALEQLVDARHAAAHALPDRASPGPTDVRAWVVLAFELARAIEAFLESAVAEAEGA